MLYQVQNSISLLVKDELDLLAAPGRQAMLVANKIVSTSEMKERIAADELFSLFTANIIKAKTAFTR